MTTGTPPGPRSLTVLVVPPAHTDDVIAVLSDYSAVGMLDAFVWVDGTEVGGSTTPASLVRNGHSEAVVLQQLLTGEPYSRIRVAVLVPAAAPVAERVPLAAEQSVEQVVRSSSMGAQVGLLRLLLTTGTGPPVPPDATLVLEGWHNLLIAPEDSAAPGLGAVPWGALSDPLDVAQRIAPAVAGVAGLWAGVETTPFDSLAILPGHTVRAVRSFYRQLDTAGVEGHLRTQLFDPTGRLPLPRGGQVPVVYVEDVPSATNAMAEALWRKHRDVLRGPRVTPNDGTAQAISTSAALKLFFGFIGASLRKAPGAWWSAVTGSVGSMVATTVQSAAFGGKESAFEVVAGVEMASWQELAHNADALSSSLGGQQNLDHAARRDLSPLWMDFVSGAMTLADGGRRTAGLEPIAVGSAIGVVPNAADAVGSRQDQFAAIPTSLAAVIGLNAVEPADVMGAAAMRDALQRAYSDPTAALEARTAGNELETWQRGAQRSYAWRVGSILVDFLGRARNDVAREVAAIRGAGDWTSEDDRLKERQQSIGVILKTLTWALLGVLVVILGFVTWVDLSHPDRIENGVVILYTVNWPFILTVCGVLILLYVVVSLALFTLAQRDLFAAMNLRQTQLGKLEAMQANLRTALADVSRLSSAYGQLLSWSRAVGPLLRAPFGYPPPPPPAPEQLADGLPRSTQVGAADPGDEARDDASHEIERRLYSLGWLTQPWQRLVEEAAERLREDPEMLFRMPGVGSASGLDQWSTALASGRVVPAGAETLWAQVERMFVDGSDVGAKLTRSVAVPTLGRQVPAQEFGAGFLDHRPGRAAPFDSTLFTNSTAIAGHSVVAVDVASITRRGLGYRAAVIQASDGRPPYDFALFAQAAPVPAASDDQQTTAIRIDDVVPPGEDMVF